MGTKFQLTEEDRENIKKLYLIEQPEVKQDDRKFCHGGNVKTLEDIMGNDEPEDYIEGVKIRKNGVGGLIDALELLKTTRLLPNISDGGEHLASTVMNTLKFYKPYNYFDETKKECNRAMDKIIELYKESQYGEELVKDIEKVYAMSHNSVRAKEFLKHSLEMIKGK